MEKKWMRGPNGKMQYMYRVRYKAPVATRSLFGVRHTRMVWQDAWVDWKTYKKIADGPFTVSELMFYDTLFED